ncbi:hypothetical protein V3C99_007779, partial [Haemonchus contortus]
NRSGTEASGINSQLAIVFDNIIRRSGDSLDDQIRNLSAQKTEYFGIGPRHSRSS